MSFLTFCDSSLAPRIESREIFLRCTVAKVDDAVKAVLDIKHSQKKGLGSLRHAWIGISSRAAAGDDERFLVHIGVQCVGRVPDFAPTIFDTDEIKWGVATPDGVARQTWTRPEMFSKFLFPADSHFKAHALSNRLLPHSNAFQCYDFSDEEEDEDSEEEEDGDADEEGSSSSSATSKRQRPRPTLLEAKKKAKVGEASQVEVYHNYFLNKATREELLQFFFTKATHQEKNEMATNVMKRLQNEL
jgi:hypothetical protein